MKYPSAYLLTFTTYGSWLHGSQIASVDKKHNKFGSPFLTSDHSRHANNLNKLTNPPILLTDEDRKVVLDTVISVSKHRSWDLKAANVLSNHLHIVVSGKASPEKIMTDIKAYATRQLRGQNSLYNEKKIWTAHGSTIYLWDNKAIQNSVRYVLCKQNNDDFIYPARK